jgi:rhodanese-related sulfurtransferase
MTITARDLLQEFHPSTRKRGYRIAAPAVARATAIALTLLCSAAAASDPAPSISPSELQARQQQGVSLQILDVRSPEEYATGHVPGAVNIPHTDLVDRLSEVESKNGVVLYCMVGPRARLGEEILQGAGVSKILHLEGGMAAWMESGLPIEKSGE